MVKVLFIFSGIDRREMDENWPDTYFFGYNAVASDSRIKAEYFQVVREKYKNNFFLFISLFKKIAHADIVFITSSAHFELALCKRFGIFRRKKWFMLNIDLTTKLSCSDKLLSVVKLADKIICLSTVQLEYLKKRGVRESALKFIPFGIDKNFYHSIPSSGEIVLAVGRDSGRDYKTLLEAMKKLEKNKAVIICRPGNIKSQDQIPHNVSIINEKQPLETQDFFAKAFVSVAPSLRDGIATGSDCSGQTVILDSMGYGCPVIASRKNWFKDYFEEDKHLIVVPPEDPMALAQAIDKVSDDLDLRKRLSQEGRKLIETKYNSAAFGKKLAELMLGEK